jgi:hypothetical protein
MSPVPARSTPRPQSTIITPGGIYCLQDSLVKFPDTDAKKTRTLHEWRTVLVMSGAAICRSFDYGCVIIAPMSHLLNVCAGYDLIIKPNAQNRLNGPGRVLLSYLQPIVKADLEMSTKIGTMSDGDWQEIMTALVDGLDH